MRYETRSVLDARSVIVAVVVLLIGAALGFGVGYKYEKHAAAKSHNTASASTNTSTTSANSASQSRAAKARTLLFACMEREGVKYSSTAADLSKPPPGVSLEKFNAARTFCGRAFLGGKP